ncbi:hypothetical protein Plhal304r1_c002g0005841 [Plasmopara halstedii]
MIDRSAASQRKLTQQYCGPDRKRIISTEWELGSILCRIASSAFSVMSAMASYSPCATKIHLFCKDYVLCMCS